MRQTQNGSDMDRSPPAPAPRGSVARARPTAAELARANAGPYTADPGWAFMTPAVQQQQQGRQQQQQQQQQQLRRRPDFASGPPPPRPPPPSGLGIGLGPISRPTRMPQWPLAGPIPSPVIVDRLPYQPPPGREPPQRPPRPSRVPSILDGSRVQDPLPSFRYSPRSADEDEKEDEDENGDDDEPEYADYDYYNSSSIPVTPNSRQTMSSVGTIPDFPLPASIQVMPGPVQVQMPPPPPSRRAVNLGPPPSSRRGASSFYSNASFVSPIPEESPRSRSRSRTSFASSAAMPSHESWVSESPGAFSPENAEFDLATAAVTSSPYDDYDDEEDDRADGEDGVEGEDESRLVRSASLGKRARPALITTGTPSNGLGQQQQQPPRPAASPLQRSGSGDVSSSGSGSGLLRASSSSSQALPTTRTMMEPPPPPPPQRGDTLAAAAALAGGGVAGSVSPSPSPRPYSRLSAIRRPPKPDTDREAADSRVSMTSLPDMIRRATRLAYLIDKGRRPASQVDPLDYSVPDEKAGAGPSFDGRASAASLADPRRSGFSDMLAAFPPPAQVAPPPHPRRMSVRRASWLPQSGAGPWPFVPSRDGRPGQQPGPPQLQQQELLQQQQGYGYFPAGPRTPDAIEPANRRGDGKKQDGRRRLCGLRPWLLILIIVLALVLVTTAIVLPLEFLVFKNLGSHNESAPEAPDLAQCRAKLPCQNGGTNVVAQAVCSCICTGGFTGSTCAVAGAQGCTRTDVVGLVSSSAASTMIRDVTLGSAIPRLLASAQANFSVPLSAASILSRFNTASLSCLGQNSLVSFDGRSSDPGDETNVATVVNAATGASGGGGGASILGVVTVVTVRPGQSQVLTMGGGNVSDSDARRVTTVYATTVTVTVTVLIPPPPPSTSTTTIISSSPATTTTTTATSSTATGPTSSSSYATPAPAQSTLTVTNEVLDFARVGVLFILQQESLEAATAAQSTLQKFFALAATAPGVTTVEASSIALGGGGAKTSIDLVNFSVDAGSGPVGHRPGSV